MTYYFKYLNDSENKIDFKKRTIRHYCEFLEIYGKQIESELPFEKIINSDWKRTLCPLWHIIKGSYKTKPKDWKITDV